METEFSWKLVNIKWPLWHVFWYMPSQKVKVNSQRAILDYYNRKLWGTKCHMEIVWDANPVWVLGLTASRWIQITFDLQATGSVSPEEMATLEGRLYYITSEKVPFSRCPQTPPSSHLEFLRLELVVLNLAVWKFNKMRDPECEA